MFFVKVMQGKNKYLDCLFAIDNSFENHMYVTDKFCPRGSSIYTTKESVWLHFESRLMIAV